MNTSDTKRERRQHERYDVVNGSFALLQSQDLELLGSLRDISAGGLSLSHIDDNEELTDHSRLAINLISEEICSEKLNGRAVWHKKEESGFTTTMIKMKSCGIAFEDLTGEMQTQLSKFIASLRQN